MRLVLTIIALLLISISGSAQRDILANKEYSIVVNEACKSFKDGGCLVTTYNTLNFEQDSVLVKTYIKADCDTAERNAFYDSNTLLQKYPYQIHKKKGSANHFIRINGYTFGLLEVFPDYLIELNADHTTNPEHIFNRVQ